MNEMFIPDCLRNPDLYDATIELLYEDEEATEKRERVCVEEVSE